LLTPRLYQKLKKEFACPEGDECALAADPWTGAQDGEIEGSPQFSLKGNSGPKATVSMGFTFRLGPGKAETRKTQVVLVSHHGCYAIADIVSNSGESSLLKQLESFWR